MDPVYRYLSVMVVAGKWSLVPHRPSIDQAKTPRKPQGRIPTLVVEPCIIALPSVHTDMPRVNGELRISVHQPACQQGHGERRRQAARVVQGVIDVPTQDVRGVPQARGVLQHPTKERRIVHWGEVTNNW